MFFNLGFCFSFASLPPPPLFPPLSLFFFLSLFFPKFSEIAFCYLKKSRSIKAIQFSHKKKMGSISSNAIATYGFILAVIVFIGIAVMFFLLGKSKIKKKNKRKFKNFPIQVSDFFKKQESHFDNNKRKKERKKQMGSNLVLLLLLPFCILTKKKKPIQQFLPAKIIFKIFPFFFLISVCSSYGIHATSLLDHFYLFKFNSNYYRLL